MIAWRMTLSGAWASRCSGSCNAARSRWARVTIPASLFPSRTIGTWRIRRSSITPARCSAVASSAAVTRSSAGVMTSAARRPCERAYSSAWRLIEGRRPAGTRAACARRRPGGAAGRSRSPGRAACRSRPPRAGPVTPRSTIVAATACRGALGAMVATSAAITSRASIAGLPTAAPLSPGEAAGAGAGRPASPPCRRGCAASWSPGGPNSAWPEARLSTKTDIAGSGVGRAPGPGAAGRAAAGPNAA
jgi:hypothetical protein